VALTRIVIDTDPGVDDAVAILLALASPELEVLGITCVAGNVDLEKTTLNAQRLVALAGRSDVPVFRGCAEPLAGPTGTAAEVHGFDGLGDLEWPTPRVEVNELGAVEFLYRELTRGRVTIVAIGPLTNLATLLVEYPDAADLVERVVIMGGASFHGNVTAAAEFNIWADPEAAAIVFNASWRIDVMPLDLTHQAFLTDANLEELRSWGTEVGQRVADMLEPYAAFHLEWYQNRDLIMHDAMAVYEVIDPTAIVKSGVEVEIETDGLFSRGATHFSRSHRHATSTTRVGTFVDNDRFVDLLKSRLATLRSPN